EILALKEQVRQRDGYCCTLCGMTNKEHRKRVGKGLGVSRTLPDGDWTLENCATVCTWCRPHSPRYLTPHVFRLENGKGMFLLQGSQQWFDHISAAAESMGLTLASFIRVAVNKGLEQMDAEQPPPPPKRKGGGE